MGDGKSLYVGIDLGGTNIQAGVMGPDQSVLARHKTKTKADKGTEAVLDRIAKAVTDLLDEADLSASDVGGLGIGAPGAIDVASGVVLNAVNLRWRDVELAKELGRRLDLPVTVDNDVNVGTWGEQQLGAGRDFDDVMGVFVGTGIGAGIVLDGRLYHGHFRTAGEIGHTVLSADAPLGRRTLEDLASRTAIVRQLTQLIRSNHPSCLPELVEGDLRKIRSRVLAEAVRQKDALTLEVIEQAAKYVGTAIANAVTLLSLPCVVLGGGLTEALGRTWVDLVRTAFSEHVFPWELRECTIVPSELEDDAGVLGAALLAREANQGK
ncbi:MAG: ROK family protein [Phycisphaeraceae bacterium]